MLVRSLVLLYGAVCYLAFLGVFLYLIGFLGDFVVPKSIDSGYKVPFMTGLLIDTALLIIFGLQHSIMARPAFKKIWTKVVPWPIERSTYVLMTNLALALLFWQWRPVQGVLWDLHYPAPQAVAYGLFALGWAIVLYSTLLINHFDLFGLRQVLLHFQDKKYTPVGFKMPWPYRFVRHPLYVGWLLAFWSTPTMTVSHLIFSLGTTAYILIAIRFEERDLIESHGEEYKQYRNRVPMLIPRLPSKEPAANRTPKNSDRVQPDRPPDPDSTNYR